MNDLIKALQIFNKYITEKDRAYEFPTNCSQRLTKGSCRLQAVEEFCLKNSCI